MAWDENDIACVATYAVLEGDRFLDQFEDSDFPFPKAGTLKMRELRFFPSVTDNDAGIELLARQMARRFIDFLNKIYHVVKKDKNKTSAEIIQALADVFADGDKTLADLAEVVRALIKFPENQPTGGKK